MSVQRPGNSIQMSKGFGGRWVVLRLRLERKGSVKGTCIPRVKYFPHSAPEEPIYPCSLSYCPEILDSKQGTAMLAVVSIAKGLSLAWVSCQACQGHWPVRRSPTIKSMPR